MFAYYMIHFFAYTYKSCIAGEKREQRKNR